MGIDLNKPLQTKGGDKCPAKLLGRFRDHGLERLAVAVGYEEHNPPLHYAVNGVCLSLGRGSACDLENVPDPPKTLDWTKPLQTKAVSSQVLCRPSRPVRRLTVLSSDNSGKVACIVGKPGHESVTVYAEDGHYFSGDVTADLENVPAETRPAQEVWINRYRPGSSGSSLANADKASAEANRGPGCEACVKVRIPAYTVGEGL